MTNKAATFEGKIDLICYCCDFCVSVRVVWCDGGSFKVVCEYFRSVVDVL